MITMIDDDGGEWTRASERRDAEGGGVRPAGVDEVGFFFLKHHMHFHGMA